jgi:hypothetical protein|tara:strand:- start:61 stop:435 length:375 start_codon:yes stop_codon:yes gene_type:complete
MDYTITELTNGNAVVIFADDSWANVPVMTNDTKEVFEERVQGYAPKTDVSNPAWIAVNQTGSVDQIAYTDGEGSDNPASDNPAWLDARIAAYGSWASQLEYITENGLTAWQDHVAAIKLANPIV